MTLSSLISIAALVLAGADAPHPVNADQLEQLDALVTANVDEGSPGVSVGIVKDGELIYERYTGLAELDHGVPIDAETRFNIASNGKQYTALCVLRLAEEGKLSLEDDVRKYLPEFYPEIESRITLAHLLSHTSGIRDVYDLWALQGKTWWKQFVGNRHALELLKGQTELNFDPGSGYLYSNSNYLLLTEVVARVTDGKFKDYANEMFVSLGMSETGFLTGYMTVVPNRARPYGDWGSWKQYPAVASLHGDGNLFTTLRDQLVWERAVQAGESAVFPAAAMTAGQGPIAGSGTEVYGFGLELGTYREQEARWHAGSTGAYGAYLLRVPGDALSVVVMSNSGRVSSKALAEGCADIVLGLEEVSASFAAGPVDAGDRSPLADVVGDYLTVNDTLIKVVERSGALFREIYQQDPVELIHEEGDLYRYASNAELKIAFSQEGSERRFTIYFPEQEPIPAVRYPGAPLESGYEATLNGRFVNDETDATFTVSHNEGDAFTVKMNDDSIDSRLMRRDLIFAGGYELRVWREDGKVTGMFLDGGRLKNVRFRRETR